MDFIEICQEVGESVIDRSRSDVVFLETIRFWIQRILLPIIVAVGIIGNSVTIIVLTRHRMKSSTNTYLTALAIADFIYLFLCLILSFQHYPGIAQLQYYLYWKSLPYIFWFTDASSGTSIWLTVSFTLERYVAVCDPLKGRRIRDESRAGRVIFCIALFNIFATSSTPFEWVLCRDNDYRITLETSHFGNLEWYKMIYYWFTAFVFCYIPLLILCSLNFILVKAVWNSQKQRTNLTQNGKHNKLSTRQRQENKITIALLSIVVLFIMCQIPTTILLIVSIFYSPLVDTPGYNYKRAFGNVCNILMSVNAATNFILYCVMSDKYRRTMLVTFFPCVTKHRRTMTQSSVFSVKSSIRNATFDSNSMRNSMRSSPNNQSQQIAAKDENSLHPPAITY